MEVTNYLKENGWEGLDLLSISRVRHPTLPLNILNYSQIDSPKFHPVVRECRGLVLDDQFNLVAKGFNRFFNLGENPQEDCNIQQGQIQEKLDGSFMLLYYYDGWRVNTRNSWADGQINGQKWADLFWRNIGTPTDKNISLVFELVSPYNMVVRPYQEGLYLLAGFDGENELNDLDGLADDLNVKRPQLYGAGHTQALEYIKRLEKDDPKFEGFVLKDGQNKRVKIKSQSYVAIHRLKNNGNVAMPGPFIKFYVQGEEAELISTFPEFRSMFLSYKERLDLLCGEAQKKLDELNHLPQKEFALSIQDLPYKSILFRCRKTGHVRNNLEGLENTLEKICFTEK